MSAETTIPSLATGIEPVTRDNQGLLEQMDMHDSRTQQQPVQAVASQPSLHQRHDSAVSRNIPQESRILHRNHPNGPTASGVLPDPQSQHPHGGSMAQRHDQSTRRPDTASSRTVHSLSTKEAHIAHSAAKHVEIAFVTRLDAKFEHSHESSLKMISQLHNVDIKVNKMQTKVNSVDVKVDNATLDLQSMNSKLDGLVNVLTGLPSLMTTILANLPKSDSSSCSCNNRRSDPLARTETPSKSSRQELVRQPERQLVLSNDEQVSAQSAFEGTFRERLDFIAKKMANSDMTHSALLSMLAEELRSIKEELAKQDLKEFRKETRQDLDMFRDEVEDNLKEIRAKMVENQHTNQNFQGGIMQGLDALRREAKKHLEVTQGLKQDLEPVGKVLKQDLKIFRTEMQKEIKTSRTAIKQDVGNAFGQVKQDLESFREGMEEKLEWSQEDLNELAKSQKGIRQGLELFRGEAKQHLDASQKVMRQDLKSVGVTLKQDAQTLNGKLEQDVQAFRRAYDQHISDTDRRLDQCLVNQVNMDCALRRSEEWFKKQISSSGEVLKSLEETVITRLLPKDEKVRDAEANSPAFCFSKLVRVDQEPQTPISGSHLKAGDELAALKQVQSTQIFDLDGQSKGDAVKSRSLTAGTIQTYMEMLPLVFSDMRDMKKDVSGLTRHISHIRQVQENPASRQGARARCSTVPVHQAPNTELSCTPLSPESIYTMEMLPEPPRKDEGNGSWPAATHELLYANETVGNKDENQSIHPDLRLVGAYSKETGLEATNVEDAEHVNTTETMVCEKTYEGAFDEVRSPLGGEKTRTKQKVTTSCKTPDPGFKYKLRDANQAPQQSLSKKQKRQSGSKNVLTSKQRLSISRTPATANSDVDHARGQKVQKRKREEPEVACSRAELLQQREHTWRKKQKKL
ncbi:hypothetical protein D6D21_05918 [Aureobasidium pullulans]|uniref:Uncharacterized protein n=1 Tax=Aureobasidium pullulans TaxID=5580 RepID=A0AB74IWT8_AURPU|nr:hypothetical protein D6D21_05918 [Aureobasidium pullulans]